MTDEYDIVILGRVQVPGGYATALRAAQLAA